MDTEVIFTSINHTLRTIEALKIFNAIRKNKMAKAEKNEIEFDEAGIIENFKQLPAEKKRAFLRKIAKVTFHENGKEAINAVLDTIKSVCESAKK